MLVILSPSLVILSPSLVILSETKDLGFWLRINSAKNLIISNELTVEILRLSPQNDIKTQSLEGKGLGLIRLIKKREACQG